MSKKTLPFFVPLAAFVIASLACNAIPGSGISGPQATINAAYTQAASGAATAGAVGNSAGATANAASTAIVATANAATGGGAATATPAAGQPAATQASGGGGGGPANGGPADIPVIDANSTVQVANQNVLSYITTADIATVVKFYKDAMPKSGWAPDASLSVETANASTLAFTKDARKAVITIGTANGQTVVAVLVS
jgi:hypothetical protein